MGGDLDTPINYIKRITVDGGTLSNSLPPLYIEIFTITVFTLGE